ncbi:MAG: hypothetical protein C0624_09985 [Desulfuromonas sp.]|nr:MAG: hypothetical protein C0624_09985 [Desulfuromonas sp.]
MEGSFLDAESIVLTPYQSRSLWQVGSALGGSIRTPERLIQPGVPGADQNQGLRPLTTPHFLCSPKESEQRNAPGILARHKVADSLRSDGSRRAFAIRFAQLYGLFRREPSLLRRRHTG